MFNSGKGLVRLFGIIAGTAFFAWVISVNMAGPAAMQQLEEFEQQAAETREQLVQAQREELRDTMLAEDGWGAGAHADIPEGSGNLRREALDMMDEAEGDWGMGAQ